MPIYLNETEGSPWLGKIRMANSETDDGTINQKSFVTAVVKYVLTANNPISNRQRLDKEKKIFLNYWKAIASNLMMMVTRKRYINTEGLNCSVSFSIPFFMKLQDQWEFYGLDDGNCIERLLRARRGRLRGIGHPDWWKTGGQAGRLNSGALNIVCQEMTKAFHKVFAKAGDRSMNIEALVPAPSHRETFKRNRERFVPENPVATY